MRSSRSVFRQRTNTRKGCFSLVLAPGKSLKIQEFLKTMGISGIMLALALNALRVCAMMESNAPSGQNFSGTLPKVSILGNHSLRWELSLYLFWHSAFCLLCSTPMLRNPGCTPDDRRQSHNCHNYYGAGTGPGDHSLSGAVDISLDQVTYTTPEANFGRSIHI